MKILVFSDSHRRTGRMLQALRENPCDLVFFLGDVLGDTLDIASAFPGLPVLSVPGNCDMAPFGRPSTLLTEEGGKRFLLTHGHTWGVKQDPHRLWEEGQRQDAHVVLFGHTHVPLLDRAGDRFLMNPGSIGSPRYPNLRYTYGEILICPDRSLRCSLREVK